MNADLPVPRLRPLAITRVRHDGDDYFHLSDPLRLAVNLRQYAAEVMGGMDVYVRNVLRGLGSGSSALGNAHRLSTPTGRPPIA